jgi:tetratricopeptide (TPR) repeat protein
MQRELADELLRQHARPRITALPEDPLRWHAAALQRGDRLGQATAAALLANHTDALALLHACLDPHAPLPAEHPHIAALILSLRRPDTPPFDASEPSPDLPTEHFRLVSLVWQRLRADHASECFGLLQQLRASAERWGDPLALLRADLLDAYAREAIGDPTRALELYELLAPLVDELFDTHGSEALWLLLRRAVLSERTGQHAEAVLLANEAWIRLRYVDQAEPSLLREITQIFMRQARVDRAELALARWREAVENQPEQLREALALERELVLARRDAELARIDGSLAKADSDGDQGPP